METKLKPCPFCGGEELSYMRIYSRKAKGFYVFVVCDYCNGQTKGYLNTRESADENFWKDESIGRAEIAWNMRWKDGKTIN